MIVRLVEDELVHICISETETTPLWWIKMNAVGHIKSLHLSNTHFRTKISCSYISDCVQKHLDTYSSAKAFPNWCTQLRVHFQVHNKTTTNTPVKGSGGWGPLKLFSDAKREMDPGKTKGHDECPLDFSAVLFPRHILTTHPVCHLPDEAMTPWTPLSGHCLPLPPSLFLSDRLTWWQRLVRRRWHSD